MKLRPFNILLLAGLLMAGGGCTGMVETAVDSTTHRAAQRTGEVVGERIGEAAGAMIVAQFPNKWTTEWRHVYTSYLFNVAFHSDGYAVTEQDAYDPGEWTRWQTMEDDEPTDAFFKRALLARTEEGNEWWHVTYENVESEEAVVLEGLFRSDRGELLRLRGRFPGEEAKEMPVEEDTYGYAMPRRLTEESIEGATEGVVNVTVPAGTFDARHVRYGAPGVTYQWWMEDGVPGGLVKYLREADNGSSDEEETPASWVVELADYGTGAESVLGVLDD